MTTPPQGPPGFDFNQLLSQAQALQQQMAAAQERARGITVEAASGGGMVTAVVDGGLQLRSLRIEPQVVDPKDVVMLQDLVVAAVNQAITKAQELAQQEMQKAAGGMLPGMF